jgi:hypothetical protein
MLDELENSEALPVTAESFPLTEISARKRITQNFSGDNSSQALQ